MWQQDATAFSDLTLASHDREELFPGIEDVEAEATSELQAALNAFEEGVYEFQTRHGAAAGSSPKASKPGARNRREQYMRMQDDRQTSRPLQEQCAEWARFRPHLWVRGHQLVSPSTHLARYTPAPTPVPAPLAHHSTTGPEGVAAAAAAALFGPSAISSSVPVRAAAGAHGAAAAAPGSALQQPAAAAWGQPAAAAAQPLEAEKQPDLTLQGRAMPVVELPPGMEPLEEVFAVHGEALETLAVQHDAWEAHVPEPLRRRKGRTRDERALDIGLPPQEPLQATLYDLAEDLMPALWARLVPLIAPVVACLVAERRRRPPPSAGFGRAAGPSTGFEVITFSSEDEGEADAGFGGGTGAGASLHTVLLGRGYDSAPPRSPRSFGARHGRGDLMDDYGDGIDEDGDAGFYGMAGDDDSPVECIPAPPQLPSGPLVDWEPRAQQRQPHRQGSGHLAPGPPALPRTSASPGRGPALPPPPLLLITETNDSTWAHVPRGGAGPGIAERRPSRLSHGSAASHEDVALLPPGGGRGTPQVSSPSSGLCPRRSGKGAQLEPLPGFSPSSSPRGTLCGKGERDGSSIFAPACSPLLPSPPGSSGTRLQPSRSQPLGAVEGHVVAAVAAPAAVARVHPSPSRRPASLPLEPMPLRPAGGSSSGSASLPGSSHGSSGPRVAYPFHVQVQGRPGPLEISGGLPPGAGGGGGALHGTQLGGQGGKPKRRDRQRASSGAQQPSTQSPAHAALATLAQQSRFIGPAPPRRASTDHEAQSLQQQQQGRLGRGTSTVLSPLAPRASEHAPGQGAAVHALPGVLNLQLACSSPLPGLLPQPPLAAATAPQLPAAAAVAGGRNQPVRSTVLQPVGAGVTPASAAASATATGGGTTGQQGPHQATRLGRTRSSGSSSSAGQSVQAGAGSRLPLLSQQERLALG